MYLIQWFDREILKALTSLGGTSSTRDQIVYFLANILPFVLVLVGGYLWYAGKTKRRKEINREAVLIAGGAALLAAGARALLADTFGRARPFETYPNLHHLAFHGTGSSAYSFPSGHMFVMFAVAGAIFFIGRHPKLSWFLFFVCAVVGLARIAAGYHYPTDIIGGAILGLLLAKLFSLQSEWARKQLR